MTTRPVPGWLSGALVGLTLGAVLWLERRRPLRVMHHPKLRRDVRNLGMTALSAAAISTFEKPVVMPLARLVERRRWGLLQRLPLPRWLEVLLAVVLLDYTLYVWHVLTHKVPAIWRLHEVHHADLDMDTTTALRFHFVEMIVSVPWRAAQVLLIGAGPLALTTWQTVTTVAILFHHGNVRLPLELERRLARVIVTPRLHGIHHSIVDDERDSNWGTIFTWPDRLHGTARADVPQDTITIGVPAEPDPARLTLGRLIAMPFRRQQSGLARPRGAPRRLGTPRPPLNACARRRAAP